MPPPTFTCPRCGMRSYHPKDIEHGYCGECHDFTGTAPCPHCKRDDGTHDGWCRFATAAATIQYMADIEQASFERGYQAGSAEMQRTFDIRWNADMRAIKRWQAAHPGNDLTWPDHADLVVWLMEQLDQHR